MVQYYQDETHLQNNQRTMNNPMDFRDVFSATSSNSDKIHLHGYQRIYPWFLHHLIDKRPVILEIGFYKGESIPLWKEYFKNPVIHICDIDAGITAAGDFEIFFPQRY